MEEDNVNSSDDEVHAEGFEEEEGPNNMVEKMTRFLALFLLKTKEENQLSQRGIDAILDSTGDVVESTLDHLRDGITSCLEINGVEVADIEGLSDVLEQPSFFTQARQSLMNEYQQV